MNRGLVAVLDDPADIVFCRDPAEIFVGIGELCDIAQVFGMSVGGVNAVFVIKVQGAVLLEELKHIIGSCHVCVGYHLPAAVLCLDRSLR